MKVIQSMKNGLQNLGYDIDLPESSGRSIQIRKWGMMTAYLVLGWMALVYAYNVMVPDLAAQAKEYAKLVYKICEGEDKTFEEAYRDCPFYASMLDNGGDSCLSSLMSICSRTNPDFFTRTAFPGFL